MIRVSYQSYVDLVRIALQFTKEEVFMTLLRGRTCSCFALRAARCTKLVAIGCSFWKNPQHIVKYELTRNKRAENDESYAQFVLDVGNGVFRSPPDFICTSGRDDFSPASVILSDDILLPDEGTLDSLISWVFGDSLGQGFSDENAALTFFEGRCIVTPTNESAVSINN